MNKKYILCGFAFALVLASLVFIGAELQKSRHLMKNNSDMYINIKNELLSKINSISNEAQIINQKEQPLAFFDELSKHNINFEIYNQKLHINLAYDNIVFNLDSLHLNPKINFSGTADFDVKIDGNKVKSGDILHLDSLRFDKKLKLEISLKGDGGGGIELIM